MNINSFFRTERRVTAVMLFALAPWVVVTLFAAGAGVAIHAVGYAIEVFMVGYALVRATLASEARAQAIVLAPAAGILVLSSVTAFWLRLGQPLIWASILWIGLVVAGAFALWRDRVLLKKASVAYGVALGVSPP